MSDRLPSADELKHAVNREVAQEHAVVVSGIAIANQATGQALAALADAHARLAAIEECQTSDVELSRDYYSTGHACQLLGVSPPELHLAMKAAEVRWVQRINSVPHLDGHGLVRIARYLRAKVSQ